MAEPLWLFDIIFRIYIVLHFKSGETFFASYPESHGIETIAINKSLLHFLFNPTGWEALKVC